MYFAEEMFNVIRGFGDKENSISINKVYLRYTGDLQTAAFLSQVVWWCDKSSRKDDFFYKTYEEWKSELYMSEYSIRKCVKDLKKIGILETKLLKANGSPTIHYKLNKTKFTSEIVSFLTKEKLEKEGSDVGDSGICENEESNLRKQRFDSANSKNPICENEESLTSLTTSHTNINNIESVSPPQASPLKSEKKKREIKRIAFAHNVFLTQKKYDELCKLFGKQNVDKKIIAFSKYQDSPSKKTYDQSQHFRTLKNWLTRDGEPNEQFGKTKQQQEEEELERWLKENGHVTN